MGKSIGIIGHGRSAFMNDVDGWLWANMEFIRMVKRARNSGFDSYITGFELGFETSATQAAMLAFPDSKLSFILAAESFDKDWAEGDVGVHDWIVQLANPKTYIGDSYHVRNMIKRNEDIITKSDAIMLCLRSDINEGVEVMAYKFAIQQKKSLYLIDPAKKKGQWIK